MSFIAQQPNGRYCRFSSVVDCPTHVNMTRDNYLNNVTGTIRNRQEGIEVLEKYVVPFERVLEDFTDLNMTRTEFDRLLIVMSEDATGKMWFKT